MFILADSIVSIHLLYKITQPSQMCHSIILEKKSAIGGGSGKVVDSSPNDHIFIYTQTMVALEFSMHNFPFAMDFKTFTETSSWT